MLPATFPKTICAGYRSIDVYKTQVYERFNRETDDGKDMAEMSELLSEALDSIIDVKEESLSLIHICLLFCKALPYPVLQRLVKAAQVEREQIYGQGPDHRMYRKAELVLSLIHIFWKWTLPRWTARAYGRRSGHKTPQKQ